MKKVVRSIAVVALMLITSTSLAKETKLNVTPKAGKNISFQMESEVGQKSIKIIDSNKQVVFSDFIKAGGFYSKKFDLSNLPKGKYFLNIEDLSKVTFYELIINDSDVLVGEENESSKPVFRSADDKLYMNLLNLDEAEVSIKVMDNEGRIVFQEKLDERVVEKVFNFQNAFENSYTLVIENKNHIYYENIVVE